MAIELLYVDEDVIEWLNVNKSVMSMADMETDPRLGYKEFKVIADCGLTLKQIHVVLLFYFCGMKQTEIAGIMRINQSNVSGYLSQSKKKILKKLTKT